MPFQSFDKTLLQKSIIPYHLFFYNFFLFEFFRSKDSEISKKLIESLFTNRFLLIRLDKFLELSNFCLLIRFGAQKCNSSYYIFHLLILKLHNSLFIYAICSNIPIC